MGGGWWGWGWGGWGGGQRDEHESGRFQQLPSPLCRVYGGEKKVQVADENPQQILQNGRPNHHVDAQVRPREEEGLGTTIRVGLGRDSDEEHDQKHP